MPKMTVIIPAYNCERDIAKCLDSILNQSYPREDFEVIVVDNNSTDNTAKVIKKYNVKYALEKRQSSYAARNKGLSLAKGEILVFTDADCIPVKDWLTAYLDCFSKTGLKLIAGSIEISLKDLDNPWMIYDKLNHMNQQLLVKTKNFAATANLMVHRDVFSTVGEFDPELISGGDSEFGQRACKKFKMKFCPKAKIYHPARGSFSGLIKKKYRLGFGFAQRHLKDFGRPVSFSDMFRGVIPAIGYLNSDFKVLKVITDHELPKNNMMKLKLFYIDFIAKISQLIGELRGRYYKE